MKISKLRSRWLTLLAGLQTINTCSQSIIRYFLGKTNRTWVDQALTLWSTRMLNLVKVQWKIINPHNIQPQPGVATIVMSNHSSLYDIPLSLQVFPQHSIRMLAKKELSKIPILGKGMSAAEFPFIDRANRSQSIKDLQSMRALLASGIVMWVFPEGTRSHDGQLANLKKGAFITAIQAKAMIIPVGIRGAYDILPARSTQFNLNQTANIYIGQPIDATKYNIKSKDELIGKVHQAIQGLLGSSA